MSRGGRRYERLRFVSVISLVLELAHTVMIGGFRIDLPHVRPQFFIGRIRDLPEAALELVRRKTFHRELMERSCCRASA